MIKAHEVRSIYDGHCQYWRDLRPEMRRLRNLYMMRFWDRAEQEQQITVETSRGYELIESFVASLFTRDPSVIVSPDLRGRGDSAVTQAVCNDFLVRARDAAEQATRLGLIYPCSFLKMAPIPGPDPLQRVDVEAVAPWDIIVDAAASSWKNQRYVGHRYLIPLEEAKQRYGNKKYAPRSFHRFLDDDTENASLYSVTRNEARGGPNNSTEGRALPSDSEVEQFIEVVEFYDLTPGSDALVVWSPDYANGDKYLYKGVKVQVGSSLDTEAENVDEGQTDEEIEAESITYTGIPYRTASGRITPPIVPMYFTTDPNVPMRGYSALRRAADYCTETNIIRTFQANAIRKCARQWFAEKGLLTPDDAAKLAQGIDGEVIEVELSTGQTLAGSFMPVPHSPTPPELEMYIRQVDSDFARGSIMAPFTRGEATRATATEVTALAAYTSSEVGRHARTRDAAVADLARVYSVMLSLILGDATEPLFLGQSPTLLTSNDLIADFRFHATDTGSTAMGDAAKRRSIVDLTQLLTNLGVSPQAIREEIVRLYDLPESFLSAEQGGADPTGEEGPPPVAPATAPESLEQAVAGGGVSPATIQPMLPGGV